MKDIIRLLPLIFCLLGSAMAVQGDYWYGDFTGDSTRVFISNAPLLETADPGSPILAELPMGIPVTVASSGSEVVLPDGTPAYMYGVSVSLDGQDLQGYMTYTSLAMASLELPSGLLFMFSVTAWDTSTTFWRGSIRIADGGNLLDSFELRPPDGGFGRVPYRYCVRALPLNPIGLSRVQYLIQLSFIYEACGYMNRDMLVAWDGERMIQGPNADSQFEAGIYSYNGIFILPSDSGGIDETVIVENTLMEWDESLEDYALSSSTKENYSWNGTEFNFEQP